MKNISLYIILILSLTVIIQTINIINYKKRKENNKKKIENNYIRKELMTPYERMFYNYLKELETELNIIIMPQVNLASIIKKTTNNYYINELFKNIDFGIFTSDYKKLLFLIEINDITHKEYNRYKRDKKVEEILYKANIPLMTFKSNYPNEKNYVQNRVKEKVLKIIQQKIE